MTPFRLLGLIVVLVGCSAPERTFVPVDGGTAEETGLSSDCTGKSDGTACGDGQICLKSECVTSSCGDRFVNKAGGEECEDGNTDSGDGCSACKLDCKSNADCKAEACVNANCDLSTPGKGYCRVSAAPDMSACKDGSGADGTCKAGVCVKIGCGDGTVAAGEDCDDMNADDTDGCRSNCKWTCSADADCDDADACNGKETCDVAAHKCVMGTKVDCTKGASCTGTCDKMTGACAFPDVDMDGAACDKDCNDADPAMFPGAFECKDGKDNDCNEATADATAPSCLCYLDGDKDGYAVNGASSIVSTAPMCPDGHTRRAPVTGDPKTLDCREGNASVFPGQTSFFTSSYCAGKSFFDPDTGKLICTLSSWDYDCDGVVTRQYNVTGSTGCLKICTGLFCTCRGTGWTGSTVPECGVTAEFRSCGLPMGSICPSSVAPRQQACR